MTPTYPLTTLAALFAAAVLTACGGSDTPAESNGPAPAPAPTADFTISLSTDKALLIQGQTATVTATVTRRPGFDGAVSITLANLPAGVSASPVMVTSGATSVPITLAALASAPHSLPTAASAAGTSGAQSASSALTVTVGGLPGVVDTSFNGGVQLTSVAEGEDYAFAMAVQPDGKVVTVGRTSTVAGGTDIAITRHLRDGTLDASFGTGGIVVTAIAPGRGADEARAVLVEPDGRIVIGGYSDASGTDKDFLVARYNPNGSLDTSFGNGGKVTTAIGSFGANELIYSIVLQPVGGETRIVAVGGEGTFIAARYTASGALDASFGNGGKINALFNSVIGSAESVTLAADNKIVIAGHIGHEFSLVQLNVDGTLDTAFGSAGKVTTPVSGTNWDEATAVVRQADGKLLVGGWVYEGVSSSGNFVVLRYNADGSADTGFGTGGQVITPVAANGRSDSGRALSLQFDERVSTVRVLQAGEASDAGGYKFALLRYWL